MPETNKAKKFNFIEFFKRLNDFPSIVGFAFCITIIFYAGVMYNQVQMTANSVKEMQSEFKDLRKDIKEIQDSVENKLDKFETILRETIKDIKTDIKERLHNNVE